MTAALKSNNVLGDAAPQRRMSSALWWFALARLSRCVGVQTKEKYASVTSPGGTDFTHYVP
ncbi:MAG: hypothetical protein N6V49_03970, partial [Serratia symbiotica]|nr:hypothetical protein [Serratia symbiotica]